MKCTKEEFMAAMRGVPAHHVAQALNSLMVGLNWGGCSKSHMAEEFERAWNNGARTQMRSIDLAQLQRRAVGRMQKQPGWQFLS